MIESGSEVGLIMQRDRNYEQKILVRLISMVSWNY